VRLVGLFIELEDNGDLKKQTAVIH
jgi:hypothetical protein